MNVVGFCGASGAGKTKLMEGVSAALKLRQQRVEDRIVVSIATDSPAALPVPTQRAVFGLNDAPAVVDHLLNQGERFSYRTEQYA
jgi:recombinational DNA repair ATPase RecF